MAPPLPRIGGIHHVTAIAGEPQENLDFYVGVLGLRLVKRSVNQDDPATYHLFYADGGAHPGSDITFFPWSGGSPGRPGSGLAHEVAFAVPPESLAAWRERLRGHAVHVEDAPPRFGEAVLSFRDPHGLPLALVATPRALERPFVPWSRSSVPEAQQIRGIHAVRVVEHDAQATLRLAATLLGMRHVGHEGGWDRFEGRDPWCGHLDVRSDATLPRGAWGVGTVHHVAWRVPDDHDQASLQRAILAAGIQPTPVIDRFWFRSVYFREPGGVLFELATDGPGFGIDEPMDALGESLVLPPWLEPHRAAIERGLPPLVMPGGRAAPPEARAERGAIAR